MSVKHHELICESLKEYLLRSQTDKKAAVSEEFTLDIDFSNQIDEQSRNQFNLLGKHQKDLEIKYI